MWDSLEEEFIVYRIDFPEPGNLALIQPEDAKIYQERMRTLSVGFYILD